MARWSMGRNRIRNTERRNHVPHRQRSVDDERGQTERASELSMLSVGDPRLPEGCVRSTARGWLDAPVSDSQKDCSSFLVPVWPRGN